jgi:hypothetical protein
MVEQMSMAVQFTVSIVTLAVVSAGVYLVLRVLAERAGASEPMVNAHGRETFRQALSPEAAPARQSNRTRPRVRTKWNEEGKV